MITKKNLSDLDEEHINEQISEICENHGVTIELLRGDRRGDGIVSVRRDVARVLTGKYGCSLKVVGRFLNRDHTSVHNLLYGKAYNRR